MNNEGTKWRYVICEHKINYLIQVFVRKLKKKLTLQILSSKERQNSSEQDFEISKGLIQAPWKEERKYLPDWNRNFIFNMKFKKHGNNVAFLKAKIAGK